MKFVALLFWFVVGAAQAQTLTIYPISPLSSTTDKAARFMSDKLAAATGQAVIVKNIVGADGLMALRAAVADKSGVFLGNANLSSFLNDPEKAALVRQLHPVQSLYFGDTVLGVPANSPVKTVADLRKKPLLTPVSGIFGAAQAKDFDAAIGTTSTAVSYTDKSQMQIDHANGLLDYTINGTSNTAFMAMVQSGRVRVLASVMDGRASAFPDVPTLRELGYRSVNTFDWNAVFLVDAMPPSERTAIAAAVQRIFASPEAAEFAKANNLRPLGVPPDAILQRLQTERLLFAK